jgi:hypothetical protein
VQKFKELPVSAIAKRLGLVGGSILLEDVIVVSNVFSADASANRLVSVVVVDFPPRHGCCAVGRRCGRRARMVLLPPCMLCTGALSTCPSFLRVQHCEVWSLLVPRPWDHQQ